MKRSVWLIGFLLVLWAVGSSQASPPIGTYAVIDKVVMEPSESAPERVQVWGIFARSTDGGTDHSPPVYGYLYFKLEEGQEDLCRREWKDLKALAGTGQCVAFAGRYKRDLNKAIVHKPADKPEKPDVYPVALGMFKLRNSSHPAAELRSLPVPATPVDGGTAAAGAVTLKARNILDTERRSAKYIFEIQNGAGAKEKSSPMAAGDRETAWSPQLQVKAGEKYTWRVWAVDGDWKGPVAAAQFKGKL